MARGIPPPIAAFVAAVVLAVVLRAALAQNSPRDYLRGHNAARAEVGVPALVWDSRLARYAQDYANKRAGDCRLVHSRGPYGENLFWGWGERPYTADDAVRAWVSEKSDYDYYSNSCAPGGVCGHYTQVVWRKTKRVGCGRVECDNDGGDYIVCSYDPPGNMGGEWPYVVST